MNSGSSTLFYLVALAAFAYEVYMLVDAIRNPIKNKVLWIVVILLGGFIGAVVYNFVGRDKFVDPSKSV